MSRRNIPQEMSGKSPLDMDQYYKVFGTTRIPLSLRDALEYQNPASPPNNIIIMINNNVSIYKNNFIHQYSVQAFSLKVLDDQRNVLPTEAILAMLEHVVKESKTPGVPVGVLTSEQRDRWARAYTLLARSKYFSNFKILIFIPYQNQKIYNHCLKSTKRCLSSRSINHYPVPTTATTSPIPASFYCTGVVFQKATAATAGLTNVSSLSSVLDRTGLGSLMNTARPRVIPSESWRTL